MSSAALECVFSLLKVASYVQVAASQMYYFFNAINAKYLCIISKQISKLRGDGKLYFKAIWTQ